MFPTIPDIFSIHPPIFVVGCPRSGTGLFRNLLRSHPRLSFPPESHFIVRMYRKYGDPKNQAEVFALADTILKLSWIRNWKLDLTRESFTDCQSFRQVVSVLFETWAKREGKGRWGDKTPQYVSAIPTLLEIFPTGKFIHCYRDGRDVALSAQRSWFGPKNVYTAARWWRHSVETGRKAGMTLNDDQYLEVRYESLLTDTVTTMSRVCRFLGEPDLIGDIRPNPLGRVSDVPIAGVRKTTRRPKNEIFVSNHGKWRQQMPIRDRAVFETLAGDLLETLGYEVEGRAREISALEKARWTTHGAFASSLARLNTRMLLPRLKNEWLFCRARPRSFGRA